MRLPDASSALRENLIDVGPNLGGERTGSALANFHDSDHVRGVATTADSTTYYTDVDANGRLSSKFKHMNPLFSTQSPTSHQNVGSTANAEARQPIFCSQVLRRIADALFKSPEGSENSGNTGAFRSLLTRQVRVSLPEWEAYHEELMERRVKGANSLSLWGLPLLHPLSSAALGLSAAMLMFDMIFTAFWVPVNVAFCLEQYGRLGAPCTRTDLAGGLVYLVNILIGFQVGVRLTCGCYSPRVVMDGRQAARLYAQTAAFWVDLLAVAPFIYLVVVLGLGDSVVRHQTVSIVSLIRLVRLVRVASIIKQIYTSSSGGELQYSWVADHFSVTPMYMALLLYLGMVLVNLYACLLLLLAHYQQLSGNTSWMSSVSWQDVASADEPVRWYSAVYYTITVMTTTGYADFVPKSPGEQVLVSFMLLNGLVMFGTVVALIGSTLKRGQETAQRAQDGRKRLTRLRQWLQEGNVPEGTCRDVATFFSELSARRDGGRTESDIVFELPAHLRQMVSIQVVKDLLQNCPVLQDLPEEVRELLAGRCVPTELPMGHDLFRQGHDVVGGGGGLWLLEEGVVGAYRNGERMEMPAGPSGFAVPCILGEGAVLADIIPACSYRMWTLRTERPCRMWQVREPALRAALQIYPNIATHIMTFIRKRLVAWMMQEGEALRPDEDWCEVVQLIKRSLIMGPLRDRFQACHLALQIATPNCTLPQLLSAWLDMSVMQYMTLNDDNLEDEPGALHPMSSWSRCENSCKADHSVTPTGTPKRETSPDSSITGTTVVTAMAGLPRSQDSLADTSTMDAHQRDHYESCVSSTGTLRHGVSGGISRSASDRGNGSLQYTLPIPPASTIAALTPVAAGGVEAAVMEIALSVPPPQTTLTASQKALLSGQDGILHSGGNCDAGGGGGGRRYGTQSESGSALQRDGNLAVMTSAGSAVHAPASGVDAATTVVELPPNAQRSSAPVRSVQLYSVVETEDGEVPPESFNVSSFGAATAALLPPAGSSDSHGAALAESRRLSGSDGNSGGSVKPPSSYLSAAERASEPGVTAAAVTLNSSGQSLLIGGSVDSGRSLPGGNGAGIGSGGIGGDDGGASSGGVDFVIPGDQAVVAVESQQWKEASSGMRVTSPRAAALASVLRGNASNRATATVIPTAATVKLSPPGPPPPAAAALVPQLTNGISPYVLKIFLDAGVNLQPMCWSSEMLATGTTTVALPSTAATPFQGHVPTITAPACSFCGCATCASCARIIVPNRAVAALRQLEGAAGLHALTATDRLVAAGATPSAGIESPQHVAPPLGGGFETNSLLSLQAVLKSGQQALQSSSSSQNAAVSLSQGIGVGSPSAHGADLVSFGNGREGNEGGGLNSGLSASQMDTLSSLSIHPPMGLLEPVGAQMRAISLGRGRGSQQRLPPTLEAPQQLSSPSLLPSSGTGNASTGGIGGGEAGDGKERFSGASGGGGASTSRTNYSGLRSTGEIVSMVVGGTVRASSSLSLGAALAAAAASVSEKVVGEVADDQVASSEADRGAKACFGDDILPKSGTMMII